MNLKSPLLRGALLWIRVFFQTFKSEVISSCRWLRPWLFSEKELDENSVCAKIAHTAADGKTYDVKFYNLEAIIAVGYRTSSYKATRFRQWSTRVLKEYLIKGFVLDDERLKQGK